MISNSQLRSEARISLGNGKWGIAIGGFLIYFIITQAIGLIPIIGPIGNILLGGPFAVGLMYFYLKISITCKTSFMCPGTFTLLHSLITKPDPSIIKVDLSIPM